MTDTEHTSRGIFALPNEIFLEIFNLFPTRALIPLTPTCRHFHSLILRLLHQRLQIASGLDGHALYLDCHRPSDRLTASKVLCTSIGTDGLGDLLSGIDAANNYVGRLKSISSLYTRFKPRRKEPDFTVTYRHPAGDVPGSRTYQDPTTATAKEDDPNEIVTETVTVDANDLFSQLTAQVYLGKRDPFRGLLFSIQEVSEGTIRVWRHWLSRQCESKSWTDGEAVVVHHDPPVGPTGKGNSRADSVIGAIDPRKDPNVLWINTSAESVGVKFRVKEKKWRRNIAPVLFSSEEEVAVSYVVEFEEVIIRTTHLLFKLEEADTLVRNQHGKAIVFGAFRG